MITKITSAQSAQIDVYVKRFREYGTSTARIDREAATKALKRSAAYLKQSEPEVWFVDSPTAMAVLSAIVSAEGVEAGREVLKSGNILRRPLSKKVLEELAEQHKKVSYGGFEAYWASFYCFIAQQLDVKKDELHEVVEGIVKECGPYSSFSGLHIVSERPTVINWQGEQLHHVEEPAIEWADGTCMYAVNGTRLPMFVDKRTGKKTPFKIAKSDIDKASVLKIANVDLRSMSMRIVGYESFLSELGARTVAVDPNEPGAELIELMLPNTTAPSRFMKMVNPSTGEVHVERVRPTDQTTLDGWKSRIPKALVDKYGFKLPIVKT